MRASAAVFRPTSTEHTETPSGSQKRCAWGESSAADDRYGSTHLGSKPTPTETATAVLTTCPRRDCRGHGHQGVLRVSRGDLPWDDVHCHQCGQRIEVKDGGFYCSKVTYDKVLRAPPGCAAEVIGDAVLVVVTAGQKPTKAGVKACYDMVSYSPETVVEAICRTAETELRETDYGKPRWIVPMDGLPAITRRKLLCEEGLKRKQALLRTWEEAHEAGKARKARKARKAEEAHEAGKARKARKADKSDKARKAHKSDKKSHHR